MSTVFLSCLSPCASANTLTFSIETFNLGSNITLTFSASGLVAGDSERGLATKLVTQLNTFFVQNNVDFRGICAYDDQDQECRLIATRSDHVVGIWGQCDFSVNTETNTTGSIIKVNNRPGLITVAEARSLATVTGLLFTDIDGNDLSDSNVADLILVASADLCSYLKNNIVRCTYFQHIITDWQYSVFLRKTPVYNFWAPQSRLPLIFSITTAALYSTAKQNYSVDPKTGELSYRFAQNHLYMHEPFDWQNEVLITYQAGLFQIPQEIKNVIGSYMSQVLDRYSRDVNSYRGGSFQVVYSDNSDGFNEYISILRSYFMLGD